ncbi:hypothetical protein CC85DRAFT_326933 [Cutaneotrichosporon oleaginosum]|uniref:Cytochrome c oxidase assembly protein COX20, mitochondrial n=1 Tax=Cutaneotrichosporon oleaginosum TaxID=879819 RepID=A0A0J0XSH8_9TREE|nr:uncharacterized protein CC85DRAFT_326933 [Cutaneotrichosporon oleaginosum]KLT44041.1 hypothetical protein CC85DRAFT_326933 [Cutaneotrichosporon oleaginosum]TXT04013.1 hypothetical protein COLE_07710 [Cutaneotrichosporon oleaginosum]
MSEDNKGAPRAPLNIPAGNSPITPDRDAQFDPEAEKLTGNWWEDRKRALKRVSMNDFSLERAGQVPCLRSSALYGISGGVGIGAIRFLGTRKVYSACNWAVLSGCAVALGAWEMCNAQRREELRNMRMIQEKFPHRHVSNLKRQGDDWEPPTGTKQ